MCLSNATCATTERYACLYTSHARNLVAYSPAKTYRGLSDSMPHDLEQDYP
jgi:5'-nucleotidase